FVLHFFITDKATSDIYTLSLHDALPIFVEVELEVLGQEALDLPFEHAQGGALRLDDLAVGDDLLLRVRDVAHDRLGAALEDVVLDRKSTRLNSSHDQNSYAVFCLKKKTR